MNADFVWNLRSHYFLPSGQTNSVDANIFIGYGDGVKWIII